MQKLIKLLLSKQSVRCQNVRFTSTKTATLSKINVLDVTRIVAGPMCTMLLGDLGANVIKVESLQGDEARKWGPPFLGENKDSHYFLAVNRNKKSVCIDLKSSKGKEIFYDLAFNCDVVVENYLPGKLDQLGVGYEKLKSIKPDIIYCALTGYGNTGPYRNRPGYDVIAAAMGGLLNTTGEKNGGPVKPGVAVTDIATGLHAFSAILAALYHRQITGEGQRIDCNLLSTQVSCMINAASAYLNGGVEPERWGTEHSNIVPYQAFKTSDGYIVLGTGSDLQFKDLCKRLGRDDIEADPRFKSNSDRVKNREILIPLLAEEIIKKDKNYWTKLFFDASFPNGPINKMKEVFEDEHIKAIELVKELEHPIAGTVKVVGPPTVYEKTLNEARIAPPTLGQHTRDVLQDFLKYDQKTVNQLFEKNIVK